MIENRTNGMIKLEKNIIFINLNIVNKTTAIRRHSSPAIRRHSHVSGYYLVSRWVDQGHRVKRGGGSWPVHMRDTSVVCGVTKSMCGRGTLIVPLPRTHPRHNGL